MTISGAPTQRAGSVGPGWGLRMFTREKTQADTSVPFTKEALPSEDIWAEPGLSLAGSRCLGTLVPHLQQLLGEIPTLL